MSLTPAALRYIGGLYESAVDEGLDLEAVRLFLASRGIARSPAMVRHELDNVFCFAGYAASHPAPEAQTYAQIDSQFYD